MEILQGLYRNSGYNHSPPIVIYMSVHLLVLKDGKRAAVPGIDFEEDVGGPLVEAQSGKCPEKYPCEL